MTLPFEERQALIGAFRVIEILKSYGIQKGDFPSVVGEETEELVKKVYQHFPTPERIEEIYEHAKELDRQRCAAPVVR